MIAKAFQPVGWVAGVAAAALGCYMLSLQVAAERAELANIDQRILAARQNIRALHTELGTRGRLQQLERRNAEVLALSAPTAGQFLDNELRLASFDTRQRSFGDTSGEVRLASVDTQTLTPAPAAPEAAVAKVELELAPAIETPLIRRASLMVAPETPLAEPAVTQASSLLDESTLRALRAESKDEREGGAGN